MAGLMPLSLIRLDYATVATPVDRLRALQGAGGEVVLVAWPNGTPYCYGWDGRSHYDYGALEDHLASLLDERSSLRFVLAFGALHLAPYYWGRDNPGELGVFHSGRRMHHASLGSVKWRRESAEAARRFARNFSAGRFRDRLVGFFPFSTGVEWRGVGEAPVNIPSREAPVGIKDPLEGDYSEPMRQAFRKYLKERYATDEVLGDAWGEPGATLASAELPSRLGVRSPTARTRDYFACYNRLNADLALAWCAALKEGAPDAVVLLPHGLVYEWPAANVHPQGSGHQDLVRLAESVSVDGFVSASVTAEGGALPLSQHPVGSLRVRGKVHVHGIEVPNLRRQSVAEQVRSLRLQVGYAAVNGSRLAWGERRHGPGSMTDDRNRFARLPYDDPKVRETVGQLSQWHAGVIGTRVDQTPVEVAVFVAPDACLGRALETRYQREVVEVFRNERLARAGFPFDEYLLDDFDRVAERYRAWIFSDAGSLPESVRRRLRATPGRCLMGTAGDRPATVAEVRAFAGAAGVHLWTGEGDLIFAGARVLVHAAGSAGSHVIRLPGGWRAREVLGGRPDTAPSGEISFEAETGQVRLFDLQHA